MPAEPMIIFEIVDEPVIAEQIMDFQLTEASFSPREDRRKKQH